MLIPFAFAFTSLVAGETCPDPRDVERRVRSILHLSDERVLNESFIVERREAGLFVELRTPDSTSVGERLLPSDGSCDELAQAAAVVLSAWLTDVHPDFAPALPAPAASALPPESSRARPVSAPAKIETLPPRPAERRVEPLVSRPSRRLELDAGVGFGIAGTGEAAPGASLSVAYVPAWGWGVRAAVGVDLARREKLGSGSVSWRRWPLAVGPTWRAGNADFAFDLTLAPALSWLRVSGSDFAPSKTSGGLTWAGFLDARLASRGRVGWFVALDGQAYFAESRAYVAESEYVLPRFVFSLVVGARVAR